MMNLRQIVAGVSLVMVLSGCRAVMELVQPAPAEPEMLSVQVLEDFPHDPDAFTQGFLLTEDGRLFESTGLNGRSSLREVNPETGEVLRQVDLPTEIFAEGLALVDDRLIQITWMNQVAFVYDLDTFEQIGSFEYEGEGWGICYDELTDQLYMSDGSNSLFTRDPETFELTGQVEVLYQGQPVNRINELECVGDVVYANIWQTNAIIEIDKSSGTILRVVNAANLLTPEEYAALDSNGVLNGIAYNEQSGNFLITGKLFPRMFEVQFVSVDE